MAATSSMAALGDGAASACASAGRASREPLETAGGIATALPLLGPGPVLIVSGDIWTRFDYASLVARIDAMARDPAAARAHLVMVPNPPYHPDGDFALRRDRLALAAEDRLTFGNIGALRHRAVRGTAARRQTEDAAALPRLDRPRNRVRRALRRRLGQRRHAGRPAGARRHAHGFFRTRFRDPLLWTPARDLHAIGIRTSPALRRTPDQPLPPPCRHPFAA